jgi:hypothetical protein
MMLITVLSASQMLGPVRSLKLTNGDLLRYQVGSVMSQIQCRDEILDIRRAQWIWLDGKHDQLLGPGKTANNMRYMRGLTPRFAQIITAGDHALAIVDWPWQDRGISYEHLMRIDTRPNLRVTPIRLLRATDAFSYEHGDKLQTSSKGLLLWNGDHLELISRDGRLIRTVKRPRRRETGPRD